LAKLTINLSLSQFPSKVSFREKRGNEVWFPLLSTCPSLRKRGLKKANNWQEFWYGAVNYSVSKGHGNKQVAATPLAGYVELLSMRAQAGHANFSRHIRKERMRGRHMVVEL
jgi:hypothetical protein